MCTERSRLFDKYYDQVSAYFSAVTHPTEARRLREVVEATERARICLEKHEKEHGCFKLPVSEMAGR
jgi:hypothetical protein